MLFLGTGIGTRAYSIIDQARISMVISAKPEERRLHYQVQAAQKKIR